MSIGLKGNSDGSGAVQVGGSDAITITTGLNTTFAGTVTATGTVAGTTGTLYPLVSGTAVASTSGTSIDFTSIPSWVKRITVMFSGVSTNGTSEIQIQIGTSGGIQTSSYLGAWASLTNAGGSMSNATSGFLLFTNTGVATYLRHGAITLSLLDSSSGIWAASGAVGLSDSGRISFVGGSKTLSGTLDRVRITTVNGTDTFDAGSINILYE